MPENSLKEWLTAYLSSRSFKCKLPVLPDNEIAWQNQLTLYFSFLVPVRPPSAFKTNSWLSLDEKQSSLGDPLHYFNEHASNDAPALTAKLWLPNSANHTNYHQLGNTFFSQFNTKPCAEKKTLESLIKTIYTLFYIYFNQQCKLHSNFLYHKTQTSIKRILLHYVTNSIAFRRRLPTIGGVQRLDKYKIFFAAAQ